MSEQASDLAKLGDPIEHAKTFLAQERQARMEACSKELAAVLEKHGCQLVALPAFTQDGRVVAQIQVAATA